jgi:hypothetical protein
MILANIATGNGKLYIGLSVISTFTVWVGWNLVHEIRFEYVRASYNPAKEDRAFLAVVNEVAFKRVPWNPTMLWK